MRKLKLITSLLCALALFWFSTPTLTMGDWVPGDGHKMHFPQLPDPYGWDVNATNPVVLADDWKCSETGWVKDIHFWGSWKHEIIGQVTSFMLSIHDDIPAAPPQVPYSRPGNTLWQRHITQFATIPPIDPPGLQGWYDPATGEFIFGDHQAYFLYNVFLNEQDWFPQEAGKIYWLNISANVADPINTQWGWKSTQNHWNDDAVWALWGQLQWNDLFEPEPPDTGIFYIALDPSGSYLWGGGSGYVGPPPPPPGSYPPWYYYWNTEWYNQWYYDGEFDPSRAKVGRIIFDVFPTQPTDAWIMVAVNWSTDLWSMLGKLEPPLPPLTPFEEDMYIGREVLLATPLYGPGQYVLDYVIRDYNPEWVSVDVQGFNFEIPNGIIEHACVQSLDLSFVITGGAGEDFGDAPDPSYPTLIASNGAQHTITGPWMGDITDGPDSEPDGQPVPPALGDDLDADGDDEDGLIMPTMYIGQTTTFPVEVNDTAGAGGVVEIWIDYDQDGTWQHPGEQAYSGFLPVGVNLIVISVPAGALPGTTYARGRISTAGGLLPTGAATDGEVEDTEVYIEEPFVYKPLVEHSKWSQPPIEWDPVNNIPPLYCGWDEPSQYPYEDPQYPGLLYKVVADDFRCLGNVPVTSIHWWGSYVRWDNPDLPPQPQPNYWLVSFWSNVPAGGPVPYSYPSVLLRQIQIDPSRVTIDWVGRDLFPSPIIFPESCFQYQVYLNPSEYFWQADYKTQSNPPDIFWISIVAVYPDTAEIPYPWGWKSRPWSWMDDAVTFRVNTLMPGQQLNPSEIVPLEYQGESYDVAFELDTEPEWIKWEQYYTGFHLWPHYEDEESMAYEDETGAINIVRLVADDWPCNEDKPVTDIAFWGSYIGYRYEACQPMTTTPPVPPDYFLLSIWTDVPANPPNPNFSHPGDKIWEYRADYDEVLVGYDKHPHDPSGAPVPGPREPVFRYTVRLPKTAWFYQKPDQADAIYWLSVVAVYKFPNQPLYPWGWTNHEHVFMDDAAAGTLVTGGMWIWEPLQDQTGATEDMSFILFSEHCFPHNGVGGVQAYNDWVFFGSPDCWCWTRQCHGDANNTAEGSKTLGWYYVGVNDLTILASAWSVKEPPKGSGILSIPNGICADFDHRQEGSKTLGWYRVGVGDLTILSQYWSVKEPPKGSGVPPDCPL